MEEPFSSTPSPQRSEDLARALGEGRSRAGDALAAQRQRMDRLEEELVDLMQRLAEELAHDGQEVDDRRSDLKVQLEALDQKKVELAAEQQHWRQTRADAEAEQHELAESLQKQQTELESRQRQLEEREALLEEKQKQLRDEEQAGEGANEELQKKLDEHQRRFVVAIEDLRELKIRNAELEEQLAEAIASQSAPASAAESDSDGGSLDWEAQKRRLLASLEADFDEEDEEDQRGRLTIEGAIQITDEIVANKQKELDELKKLLDDQSSRVGEMAIGAAAIAEVIDQDELIQEERARLERLKTEWKEKLRKAEVDMSVQRANLARREAKLQDKLHAVETEAARLDREKDETRPEKPDRGRWLTRLGLKEKDQAND